MNGIFKVSEKPGQDAYLRIAELEAQLAFNKETLAMVFNERDEALRQVAVLREALEKIADIDDEQNTACWIAAKALSIIPFLGVLCEETPHIWEYRVNDTWTNYCVSKPPEDAYDEGSLIPLYRKKEK